MNKLFSYAGVSQFLPVTKTDEDHHQAQLLPEAVQEHHEVHEQPRGGSHEGAGLRPKLQLTVCCKLEY